MELDFLKDFVILAETRHFAEAAERLFISPSALTRHIQAIEKEFGQQLFLRTTKRVELTDFGKVFLPYAQKIVTTQREYLYELFTRPRRDSKLLIGAIETLAPCRSSISKFQRQNPDITLEYFKVPPEKGLDLLRSDQIDFLITDEDLLPENEFHSFICEQDHYVALAAPGHPLAGQPEVHLSRLEKEKLILTPALADRSSPFMTGFTKAGLYPNYILTEKDDSMDLALIKNHIAILSRRRANVYSDGILSIVEITPKIAKNLVFVYRKQAPLSALEAEFVACIRADLQKDGVL